MYSRIIEFSIWIITYFRTHPISKFDRKPFFSQPDALTDASVENLAKSLLGRFESEITDRSKRILQQGAEIDAEAQIAGQEATDKNFETLKKLLKHRPEVSVKPAHHIPFSINPLFVGRETELEMIKTALDLNDPRSVDQGQRAVVIHGLGGLGKTEIALAFAHQSEGSYDSVLWVSAETPEKVQTSFSEIAVKLNIGSAGEKKDEKEIRKDVMHWLNTTGK